MKSQKNRIERPESKSLVFTMSKLSAHVKKKLAAEEITAADVRMSHFKKDERHNKLILKFGYRVYFLHDEKQYLITV